MAEKLHLTKGDTGSYVLVLSVEKPCLIQAGMLPEREFLPGIYFYIGRAKRALKGRLARHLRAEKKFFWHIDYLLDNARIKEIWCRLRYLNECQMASEIFAACGGHCTPIPGFGASDCRCFSHLIHYKGGERSLSPLRKTITHKEVNIDDIQKDPF